MLWFVKSRRAQTVDDFETWIEGGVSPTLNVFDNGGETRATILIIDGTRVDDVRVYEDDVMQTVIQRWGTGGGNVPAIFEYRRDEGVRITDGEMAPTVQSSYGTGGGNVPYVYPIQDGREMEKNQNGLGLGSETDPAYTLDQTGAQAVAYSIREDATANNFSATEIEQARAIQALQPSVQSHHAQTFIATTVAYDEYNDSISDVHQTIRAGTKQSTGVLTSTVRRLTPTECERLQGFPDGWTTERHDYKKDRVVEQADSSRYKQMGNAVAVPVVNWIINRLVSADADDRQT
jgi:DNA (cytosine-5)-methyltransferase 1